MLLDPEALGLNKLCPLTTLLCLSVHKAGQNSKPANDVCDFKVKPSCQDFKHSLFILMQPQRTAVLQNTTGCQLLFGVT